MGDMTERQPDHYGDTQRGKALPEDIRDTLTILAAHGGAGIKAVVANAYRHTGHLGENARGVQVRQQAVQSVGSFPDVLHKQNSTPKIRLPGGAE